MALPIELSDALTGPEVEKRLSHALDERLPFSFVRIGDGEGMALARQGGPRDPLRPSILQAFGPAYDQPRADALGEHLDRAVGHASILGLRAEVLYLSLTADDFKAPKDAFLLRYKRSTEGHEPAEKKHDYQSALRLAHMVFALERLGVSNARPVSSAWVHYDLLASGYLARLVLKAPRIGLISCRRSVARKIMTARTGPTLFFPVLEHFGREKTLGVTPEHWWQSMETVSRSLTDVRPGDVFLIGAGIWGKAYCEQVRAQGGIAIDMGSALDIWAGINTRPSVMPLWFEAFPDTPPGEVPRELRLESQLAALA